MSKTVTVQVRMEPELKAEAEKVLASIGLNATTAVRMFFRYIANNREVPLDFKEPNGDTLAALQQARDPDFLRSAPHYNDADAMIADILHKQQI